MRCLTATQRLTIECQAVNAHAKLIDVSLRVRLYLRGVEMRATTKTCQQPATRSQRTNLGAQGLTWWTVHRGRYILNLVEMNRQCRQRISTRIDHTMLTSPIGCARSRTVSFISRTFSRDMELRTHG